jgi:hypothetical protein
VPEVALKIADELGLRVPAAGPPYD